MWKFQILVVSAVKICKECLQKAASAFVRVPQTPYRGFAPDPTSSRPPEIIIAPRWKFLTPPLNIIHFCYKESTVRITSYTVTFAFLRDMLQSWKYLSKYINSESTQWKQKQLFCGCMFTTRTSISGRRSTLLPRHVVIGGRGVGAAAPNSCLAPRPVPHVHMTTAVSIE